MCGLVGVISNKEIDEDNLRFMNDTMIHRGPDGAGVYLDGGVGFGHRRLAIVDLSNAGKQPMHYLSRYTITYNGEIYNYPELRVELESAGYEFLSDTDTEVVMAAYDYWGEACFNKFNGMWAFCIYDSQADLFVLSRDRFGIKPLYYWSNENSFVFASEIKAILAYEDFGQVKPNTENIKCYLAKGPQEHISETAFEGVKRFPFSCYSVVTKTELLGGSLNTKPYWSLSPNNGKASYSKDRLSQYSLDYKELLKDAVKLRLRADVKVGSALSGGIDSSSIVSLINESLAEEGKFDQQETFSSVYKTSGTRECDESRYIDLLAKHLNVKSNQIEPVACDIPNAHAKMIYHTELPPSGTLMSGWHTFKLVSQSDVVVTLDGQGADEQLAGYDGYVTNYVANTGLFSAIFESAMVKRTTLRRRAIKGVAFKVLSSLLGQSKALKLLKADRDFLLKQTMPLNEKLKRDLFENLVTLLHYSDRVSMAHSIESRMPFLDYRLVEFLANVPACYKYRHGWSKFLARVSMADKLPPDILWRKDKMGWPIPEEHWFNGQHKDWLHNKIESSKFLKTYFPSEVEGYRKAKLPHKLKLLNLAVWSDTFCVQ